MTRGDEDLGMRQRV